MNSALETTTIDTSEGQVLNRIFAKQKAAAKNCKNISLEERLLSLTKLETILIENQEAIADAINKDFGNRAVQETQMSELFGLLGGIKYNSKRLKKWMKPQKRHVGLAFFGGKKYSYSTAQRRHWYY